MGRQRLICQALLLPPLLLCGCAQSGYHVAVLNMTEKHMEGVATHVGGETARHGYVGPTYYKSWGLLPHPVPSTATVTWRTGDHDFSRTVPIPQRLRRLDGTLYFRFMPGGEVDLVALPKSPYVGHRDPRTAPPILISRDIGR